MHEFFIAIALFGLFVAGLSLRQRRHPGQAGGGCAHHGGRIRRPGCSPRAGVASPPPASR